MPYIVKRQLKVGGQVRYPGEIVRDEDSWKRIGDWVASGYLQEIPELDAEQASRLEQEYQQQQQSEPESEQEQKEEEEQEEEEPKQAKRTRRKPS